MAQSPPHQVPRWSSPVVPACGVVAFKMRQVAADDEAYIVGPDARSDDLCRRRPTERWHDRQISVGAREAARRRRDKPDGWSGSSLVNGEPSTLAKE